MFSIYKWNTNGIQVCVMYIGKVVSIFSGNQLIQTFPSVREQQVWKMLAYYKIIFLFILGHTSGFYCLSFSYLKPKHYVKHGNLYFTCFTLKLYFAT
jgi:hypothetical protein